VTARRTSHLKKVTLSDDDGGQRRVPSRRRDPGIDKEILKTALDLFLEQGIEGANFEQISKRTGIPRSTIYRRWKTRSELLNATLWSARMSGAGNPDTLSQLKPAEFICVIEDALVTALNNPILPKLISQLIGASHSHPELLAIYCRKHVEPGWQALFKALEKARLAGVVQNMPDPEILRDLLGGAVVHRLISKAGRVSESSQRAWVKRLLRQIGITNRID
jgi:Bacterial regulatory proteins, tetR family/Tetracyclin repressor-like, C-terminal domain